MTSDQIEIRAGDLTAEHIGWTDSVGRTISNVGVRVLFNGGSEGVTYHANSTLTLSPPAPIRRRITWADLRDTTCSTWVDLLPIEASDETPVGTETPLSWWVPWFIAKDTHWVVIEVPSDHPLATAGEPADG